MRCIIDSFQSRWQGVISKGVIDMEAITAATAQLLTRLKQLLTDVKVADQWCTDQSYLDEDSDSDSAQSAVKIERDQSSANQNTVKSPTLDRSARDQNSLEAGPIYRTIAMCSRFWMYQELVFLHYELWERYHTRHDSLLFRYIDFKLPWQNCWLQEELVPSNVKNRILAHLHATQPVGYTKQSIECDDEDGSMQDC